jgi:long-chain acyl-CoA synthetase
MWAYPEIRTLGDLPDYYARTDPQRIALKSRGRTVNFVHFERTCRQVAHFVMARNTAPGNLIGFLGKNSFDFYFAFFGCAKTQAALVVLNWMLSAIAAERPTLMTLTPTMLQILLDHPNAATTDFSSLRLTLYAGSPISLGLIKRAIAVMPCQFMQFYGSTESGGAASLLRPQEHDLNDEARLQSCGRPLPLIEFKIIDARGDVVPDGTAGELLIRAPGITKGYWRQPDATAAVLQNGWYRTGDIARRDPDGLYYIVDRAKDMIVSGGENIYSVEVESALSVHPAIAAVAVIGVPDERWGEAVKALVIRREGQQVDEATLIRFCRGRLAAYKVPKSVEFVDRFPLVASGKVSKKELRERYWKGSSRGVA